MLPWLMKPPRDFASAAPSRLNGDPMLPTIIHASRVTIQPSVSSIAPLSIHHAAQPPINSGTRVTSDTLPTEPLAQGQGGN